ncbi:RsiV family protein [Hymenobacter sp. 15J16-1T3B]|uniref:RsiV family protein n=1 Tax=Hymenobacter sp. 15J16-1T3B TaxID=2886941 RepID=UPI001D119CD1|nr:RsiV family protein [Hymenobacter sp. 15J16-1T3B]MCC3157013.1 RsiV family protein [Hymenobacter sp. 15J16-1T3B]
MLNTSCQRLRGVGLALSLLTACESRRLPADAAPPVAGTLAAGVDSTAAAASEGPSAPAHPTAAGPALSSYRRYVGTVGAAPVVLELTVADSVRGTYYYQRRGGPLTLAARPAAGAPLVFRETDGGRLSGRWQAQQPLGPELSGTWLSPDGRRRLPFRLREDYAGAVRYVLEAYESEMPATAQSRECGNPADTLRFELGVVHVLLPYPSAAVGRVARALLPAPPARLQRYLDQQLREEGECSRVVRSAWLTYNADDLLSVEQFELVDGFGVHPNSGSSYRTFDLRAGRELQLTDLLRPGFELPLRRLLSARLRTDPGYADFYHDDIEGDTAQLWWPAGPDGQPLAPLPKQGFHLTPAGLGFGYNPYEIAPYVVGPTVIEISYPDLKPLVRPGSPLARLLRARGL